MTARPVLFVGSSAEGLQYAKALQVNLDRSCQVVLWSQGVFGLSGGTLEDLVDKIVRVDFAALIVTPDDLIESRSVKSAAPRDNVLLELGICIGAIGRERSFLVHDRSKKLKLPTDLAGITHATFQPHDDGNAPAALGAACTLIENKINELGERVKHGIAGVVDDDSQFRIIADLLGVIATNYLIQIYETGGTLQRERGVFSRIGNYWYGIEFPGRHLGNGRFSIDDLCEKMPDAGIISQDLKFNVSLTERGKTFVKWLVQNGYKARSFISPLGSWGTPSKFTRDAVKFFQKDT
jgi:hypothetical protein